MSYFKTAEAFGQRCPNCQRITREVMFDYFRCWFCDKDFRFDAVQGIVEVEEKDRLRKEDERSL